MEHAPPADAAVRLFWWFLRRHPPRHPHGHPRRHGDAARADHRRGDHGPQRRHPPGEDLGPARGDARLRGRSADVTGFEVHLVRDPRKAPAARAHRVCARPLHRAGEPAAHLHPGRRAGAPPMGALEMEKFGPRQGRGRGGGWCSRSCSCSPSCRSWPAAWPNLIDATAQEQLAHAADRFGGGDLAFRADVGRARRWVALEVRRVAVSFNRMAERVEAVMVLRPEAARRDRPRAAVALGRARARPRDRARSPSPAPPSAPRERARRRREAAPRRGRHPG